MAIIKNKTTVGFGVGDLEEIKRKVFLSMYPLGSIFITVSEVNPTDLFGGTWEKLPDGYYLRASSSDAGTQLDEELPNIKGQATLELTQESAWNGALSITKNTGNRAPQWEGSNSWGYLKLDASKMSNSVYKDNGKVQPKSIKVYIYKRIS